MTADQSNMVDSFLEGNDQSDANLDFTLTKDQLTKIKSAFKPLQFEEFIQFELQSNGKITVSSVDKGIAVWVDLSTTEMDLRNEEYQVFFIDLKRINKLADVCSGAIKFEVQDGEMRAKIGTTDLHISLPLQDLVVDVSFNEESVESMTSDTVANLTSRLSASKGAGSFMLPVMELGQQWKYGTSQSVSLVDGGFQSLVTLVSPDFLDYLSNIPFTKEDVAFRRGKDDGGAPCLTVSSDNVHYKIVEQPVDFQSVDELFETEADCTLSLNTLDTVTKLDIVSIPLVGQDNAAFEMSVADGSDTIEIKVQDEGHRESHDEWKCAPAQGSFVAPIGLQPYLSAVKAMSKENVTIESRGPALVLSDDQQKTILIKYM